MPEPAVGLPFCWYVVYTLVVAGVRLPIYSLGRLMAKLAVALAPVPPVLNCILLPCTAPLNDKKSKLASALQPVAGITSSKRTCTPLPIELVPVAGNVYTPLASVTWVASNALAEL